MVDNQDVSLRQGCAGQNVVCFLGEKKTLIDSYNWNSQFRLGSETQAGIKIAGRNINNLRYADDTTLMAESEEELKSLLVRVESEKLV